MAILHDLYTNKDLSADTAFQYHYVIDLHNKIRNSCRLAQESVCQVSSDAIERHEPKAKLKKFEPDEKVLVLLPKSDNKLVMQLKGPTGFAKNNQMWSMLLILMDDSALYM
ncbi:reverse transcriptase [Elysia marginata]|uniref:Reverse transcriptase n=1 Tax=Elysia marginata TaxID=1093978 RepID=A0AAV4H5K4_9GAST|nr:reverse transcriptase [Elysia marginata]